MPRKTASRARSKGPELSSTGEITADAGLAQAQKNAAYFKKLLTGMHMHEGMSSVREADYKGHHVVIETTYKITIDGRPFSASLGVTNDGSVHYHGMPNVGFNSAIDLMKAVIDTFPDEFARGGEYEPGDEHHHGGEHDHGSMMMARRTTKTNAKARATAKAKTQPKATRRPAKRGRR